MRSLFSGVAGLQNHQTRMDVLGNNIANVNTIGFKKGRVTFQDMLSQTIAGAARPREDVGGVNPKQVGLGMTIAAIDTLHSQGSLQTTGNMTDLAIQGEGMFVLSEGDKQYYTRAGAFGIDSQGVLVNQATGLRVQGWQAERIEGQDIINTAAPIGNIAIPLGTKEQATATTEVYLQSNLDKRLELIGGDATDLDRQKGTWTTTFGIFDSFGNEHTLQIGFQRSELPNQWLATVNIISEDETIIPDVSIATEGRNENTFRIAFDNLGALQSIGDNEVDQLITGALQAEVSFAVPGATGDLRQTFNLNLGEVGSYTESLTQFAESSSSKIVRQNGNGMGFLESFRIDQSGTVAGVFSNGVNRSLAQLALASFSNPGGLEKSGETNFIFTNNSGAANIGASGTAGKGKIVSGSLEMSNVDLAEQFTDMIVTQRGFQANSRTITTSDQMLQELLQLKR